MKHSDLTFDLPSRNLFSDYGMANSPLGMPRVHMPYRDKISCSIERDSLDLYNFKANTRDKKLKTHQVSRMETWNTCFSELKKKKTSYLWLSSFFNSLPLINKQKRNFQ